MEITGKITTITPIQIGQSKDGKEWKKQEVVLQTDGQYPKNICVTLFKDKTNPNFKLNDEVKFDVNIESSEYNGKYYTTITAFKYDVIKQVESYNSGQPNFDQPEPEVPTITEDLPF